MNMFISIKARNMYSRNFCTCAVEFCFVVTSLFKHLEQSKILTILMAE